MEVSEEVKQAVIGNKNVKQSTKKPINNKSPKQKKFERKINCRVPKHIMDIALVVINNSEIRRFTSIGILNYLNNKGDLAGAPKYVTYKFDKFIVHSGTRTQEYLYNEVFFLTCLAASFTSFSNNVTRIINNLCEKETNKNISEVLSNEEISNVVFATEEYVADKREKDALIKEIKNNVKK